MSKSLKHREFNFSFKVFLRLLLFVLIVYLLISYFSGAKTPPTNSNLNVLGNSISNNTSIPPAKKIYDDLYRKLPPESQQTLNNLDNSPAIILIQEKFNVIKEQSSGFPQKQIADIKKSVVKMIYEEIMKSLDSSEQP